jgi:hypothetical protein
MSNVSASLTACHSPLKTIIYVLLKIKSVFGLFPSSSILENRKHDVSETGSVSVLRLGREDTYSVRPLRKS